MSVADLAKWLSSEERALLADAVGLAAEAGRAWNVAYDRAEAQGGSADLAYSDQPVTSFPPKTMRRIMGDASLALNPGAGALASVRRVIWSSLNVS